MIRSSGKPVVVALMGEDLIVQAARLLRQAHIPDYRFPERAASALRVLAVRAEQLAAPALPPRRPRGIRRKPAEQILASAVAGKKGFLGASTAADVLAAYGVQIPASYLARTPEDAAAAARRIGFPVVLKTDSPDLPHKSDVGGVLLDLASGEAVTEGFRRVRQAVRSSVSHARLQGVLVQKRLPPAQEVIIGVVRDPQFGPLVMFGSGGVEVEGLNDVAFGLAPLERGEAEALIDATWAGRRMRGYRSLAPADREAVIDAVVRVAQLAVDFPQITELEINPLRVYAEGDGAFALDVRIRVT
jgi:acetyltransferase